MKKTLLPLSFGIALCGSLVAGPADDIAKKHARATAAELEAYLEKNPDAPDKDRAYQVLLMSYNQTGDTEKSIAIFQSKFKALGSGSDVPAGSLYGTTRSLFNLLVKNDRKEEAAKLIEEAIQKSMGNEKEDQLVKSFQLMRGQLTRPVEGDTMEMKFTSLQGEEVDLAAMKGKVVLIDFWATWCGPCIAELPHLTKAYEKYHKLGFEIIGISLDKQADKEKLESFINEKKMPWPQHFDGNGGANAFAVKYGVSSIPSTFLIGKDGKIIAIKLRGDALEKALEQQLGE